MKFEMTKCNQCGSGMLMGVTVCPSCGKEQYRIGKLGVLPASDVARDRTGCGRAARLKLDEVLGGKPSHLTSICRPSFSIMAANFVVSACTKSENCCGVP